MTALAFRVFGEAVAKGSMKTFAFHLKDAHGQPIYRNGKPILRSVATHDNPKTKTWQQVIAQSASDAVRARNIGEPSSEPWRVLDGATRVSVAFYLPRPVSLPKKTIANIKGLDVDKMARLILDSLSGLAYGDDRQVVELIAGKYYAAEGEVPRGGVMAETRFIVEDLPPRLRKLPLDARGYPVPWFVAWVDGEPEFRAADAWKFWQAVQQKLCWVCGEPLGKWLAFPIGPMCAITRTTAEPPCHTDCAEWSIRNCPFLSQPRQARRDDNLPDGVTDPAGFAIKRNPGVICLWITRGYELFNDGRGKPLITVGKPERVSWWCEGRAATRAEVDASVESGLLILLNEAKRDGPFAIEALGKQVNATAALFPVSTA